MGVVSGSGPVTTALSSKYVSKSTGGSMMECVKPGCASYGCVHLGSYSCGTLRWAPPSGGPAPTFDWSLLSKEPSSSML